MASLHSNRGAKRAREARKALGYHGDGPLPDLLTAVEEDGVHVVVLTLPDEVAGAYIARPDCPLLFVNGHQAIVRQRFTLAHEFGHRRMGHSTVVDEQKVISGHSRDPKEISANAFAAEFLMPRGAVAEWALRHVGVRRSVTLEHVVLLACEYGVSAQAARYALQTAGVLADERRCQKLDEEIKDQLHVSLGEELRLEWLQDGLADALRHLPHIPNALRGSVLGDLLAGEIDAAGAAERLGRPVGAVESMLAEFGLDQLLPAG